MSEKMTWEQVVALEPRLQVLFDKAASAATGKESFCASDEWYGPPGGGVGGGLKQRMIALVGGLRRPTLNPNRESLLQSHHAYDAAYQAIYGQLPDCFNADCGCMG